jgi:RNA polymerase sigma-70 factor (ECF subfamily)
MMAIDVAVREAGEPVAPVRAVDHVDRLYRLARSQCGSRELAEDIVQEAYVRLLARPRLLRGRGGEFPYLARIVRNLLNDHYRQARREDLFAPAEGQPEPVDHREESDPEAMAQARHLYALVSELPPDRRDVVAAVDIAGMSYREAARTLDVPIGTVMSRLARARASLAQALG